MDSLQENKEIFKEWHKEYVSAMKIPSVFNNDKPNGKGFYAFMLDFKNWLYSTIHTYLEENKSIRKYEETIRAYCIYIKEKILPICYAKIKHYSKSKEFDSHIYLNNWIDLEDDFFALASFRDLKMFALYLERGKSEKLWKKTIHLFENFFDYAQRLVFGEKIELIRASYFPGAGKTYGANILCAFWWGVDSEMSILRITYSDDLCSIFIQQIANIINSKQYRKVFPRFDLGEDAGNMQLYSKYSIAVGFQFSFSSVMNFYASTRDGQTTGKRGRVLIIDDLTKGADEAFDEKLHKRMENKFDTEWGSRADSSYQPIIALGTMWSNLDLLNILHARAMKDTDNNLVLDSKYKYTELAYNKDGTINSIFISTPILDYDTDESTCPLRYTTESMKKKRGNMDEALWNAVYQQRPTPPEEFLFAYSKLQVYNDETYPREEMKTKPTQCYAFIDPTRKGKDFFAMGIFKRYNIGKDIWSNWYLVDCIFEQAPTKELLYDIAYKIQNHRVQRLGYENNIDMSFDDLLKYKLKEINYHEPFTIDSFFSYKESKETKISNASFGMKREIVYPSAKMYSLHSPMGKGMQQFTTWSLSQRFGDHDDFPDMISMFVKYYCETTQQNTMIILNKNFRI